MLSAMNFNYSSSPFMKIASVLQKKLLPIILFFFIGSEFQWNIISSSSNKRTLQKKCNTITKTVIYSSRMYLGLIFIFLTCRSILMSYVKVYIWMTVNRCSRINKLDYYVHDKWTTMFPWEAYFIKGCLCLF